MRVVAAGAVLAVALLLAVLVARSIAGDLRGIGLDWWLLVPAGWIAFMAFASWAWGNDYYRPLSSLRSRLARDRIRSGS